MQSQNASAQRLLLKVMKRFTVVMPQEINRCKSITHKCVQSIATEDLAKYKFQLRVNK